MRNRDFFLLGVFTAFIVGLFRYPAALGCLLFLAILPFFILVFALWQSVPTIVFILILIAPLALLLATRKG